MKKLANTILCVLVIQLYAYPAYSQEIKLNQNLNLKSIITTRAIYNPWSLQVWYPPPPEPPYINGGGDSSGGPIIKGGIPTSGSGSSAMGLVAAGVAAPLAIGGGLLAFFLTRGGGMPHPSVSSPAINPKISLNNNSGFYNFEFGEEIVYNMVFKNTSDTPIYPDSTLYVKVPAWMDYKLDSTYINNTKLTDLADDDVLTYFKDDSLLVFKIGNTDTDTGISINFGGKVLTNTVSINEAFCLVKFQSIENRYETDWKSLSLKDSKPLPPILQKVMTSK